MWAEVKSYMSASSSFKKYHAVRCWCQNKLLQCLRHRCRGNYEDMLFPAFLPPPQIGLVVHILIKNIPLYFWSDSCDLLSMEIGKFYLIVLPYALGSVQSCWHSSHWGVDLTQQWTPNRLIHTRSVTAGNKREWYSPSRWLVIVAATIRTHKRDFKDRL